MKSGIVGAILLLAFVGCQGKKDEPVTSSVASAAAPIMAPSAGTSAAPADLGSMAVAARDPELDVERTPDAGTDGGPVRKLRRIVAAASAASVEPASAIVAGAATPDAPDVKRPKGKPVPTQMGDEQPYGGSPGAVSGAAVLKKTPLPSEDPWAGTKR